jgi:hypothetical protein
MPTIIEAAAKSALFWNKLNGFLAILGILISLIALIV